MFERRFAVFAALAGHFEAAEWRGHINDVIAVDPHGTRFDMLGVPVSLVDVLGPDCRGQTVVGSYWPARSFLPHP